MSKLGSKRSKRWMLTAAAVVSVPVISRAASPTYDGPNGGNFTTANDWSTHAVPGSGDDVIVGADEGSASSMTVYVTDTGSNYSSGGFDSVAIDSPSSSQSMTVEETPARFFNATALETGNLDIGQGHNGTFIQAGVGSSNNTVTGYVYLGAFGQSGGDGEYDLDTPGSLTVNGGMVLGDPGTGTFVQNTGAVTTGLLWDINGTYNMSGGTLLASQSFQVGGASAEYATFTQTGGGVTVGSSSAPLNSYISGSLLTGYEIDSGGTSTPTLMHYGNVFVGDLGYGHFDQNVGTVTITGNLTMGDNSGDYGTVGIDGGTTSIGGSVYVGGLSTGAGGTGLFEVFGSANVTITNTLKVWNTPNNQAELDSGTLTVGNLDTSGNPSLFQWTGGTLHLTNQTLDFSSSADSSASFGNSLTIANGQSLIVDFAENMNGVASNIKQTGGSNNTSYLNIGNTTSNPTHSEYDFSGGTLTVETEDVGIAVNPGNNGGGTFVQSGGFQTVQFLNVGFDANGVFDLGSGQLDVTKMLSVSATSALYMYGGIFSGSSTVNDGTIQQTLGFSNFGNVTGSGSLAIGTPTGSLTQLELLSVSQASVTINNMGQLRIDDNTTAVKNVVNSLSIIGNGTLNIENNVLIINYGSGPDPISSIVSLIKSAYDGGVWDGYGITSLDAYDNAKSYGVGYADYADPGNPAGLSSGQIEIMYTLLGDGNLDGKVNGTDFTLLAASFNQAVTNGWDRGDFNYSGSVNGSDFLLLANEFNQFASQSAISSADLAALDAFASSNGISLESVPEPASVGIVTFAAAMGLARRRRKLHDAKFC